MDSRATMVHLTEAKDALERQGSPSEDGSAMPQPASPSHSWSSASTEVLPLQSDQNLGEAPGSENRPKRCKISREQLSVLIKSFDEEPLPNFDQRQALAKMLGMTPRSVQIWFQNRRQRLKPAVSKGASDDVRSGSSMRPHEISASSTSSHHVATARTPSGSTSAHQPQNSREYGIPGLAAAANLCNTYPSDMRMVQHLPHLQPSNSLSSFNLSYDVMEPFAATKALLGAGYHPPSSLSGLGPRLPHHMPSGRPSSATCSRASHGGVSSGLQMTGVGSNGAVPVHPGSAAGAVQSPTSQSLSVISSGNREAPSHAPPASSQADGLLLLLACADSSSPRGNGFSAGHVNHPQLAAPAAIVG